MFDLSKNEAVEYFTYENINMFVISSIKNREKFPEKLNVL